MTLPNFLQGFAIKDKQSLDCFNDLGLPTKANENWHYLDMKKKLAKIVYRKQDRNQYQSPIKFKAVKIQIVNGNIKIGDNLPKGLKITVGDFEFSPSLSNQNKHAFVSLNNAIDGAVIKVDISEDMAELIHIEHYNDCDKLAVMPKIIVNIEAGKSASIFETLKSRPDMEIFINSLMEIFVADGAKLLHYKSQQDIGQVNYISYTKAHLSKQSIYAHTFACINNLTTRNEVEIDMLGVGGSSFAQGVYIGKFENVIDNTIRINHFAPNCESQQLFKGVLNEKSQGTFQGKIYVDKLAQKTDGYQMHRSILLSDEAQVNGKPELEIYADDVKCSHGSSTGEINPQQLFYLTSRGIEDNIARKLLIEAFLTEVFDNIDNDIVKDYLQGETVEVMERIL